MENAISPRKLNYPYNNISMVFWQLSLFLFVISNFKTRTILKMCIYVCVSMPPMNKIWTKHHSCTSLSSVHKETETPALHETTRSYIFIWIFVTVSQRAGTILVSSCLEPSFQFSPNFLFPCLNWIPVTSFSWHFLLSRIFVAFWGWPTRFEFWGVRIWMWLHTQLTFWRDKVAFEFKFGAFLFSDWRSFEEEAFEFEVFFWFWKAFLTYPFQSRRSRLVSETGPPALFCSALLPCLRFRKRWVFYFLFSWLWSWWV